jgi:GT2 family glycosyltransferase
MQPVQQPHITIVILNTNRRDDTLACLESLAHNTYPHQHTIVLDNASSDGSWAAIAAQFPEVEIVQLAQNLGYAGNNNVGIQRALEQDAEWVLVLNEDTILAPDCLSRLAQVACVDQRIGIVGPMIYHHNEPQVIQSAGGWFDSTWQARHLGQNQADQGQYTQPHDVAWVSGCAIMVRRQTIEQIGAIDERLFYYWEETEWCMRAKQAGWRIVHVPGAHIWHKGVQRNYRPKPGVAYYNTRNRLFVLHKHHAPRRVRALAWAQLARTLTSMSIRPKWRASRMHRNAMLRGMFDFLHQRWGQGPY